MKKGYLVSVAILLWPAIAAAQISINGLEFPANKQEFLRIFGNPNRIVAQFNLELSDSFWTYHYKCGTLSCYYKVDAFGKPRTSADREIWLDSLRIMKDGWKVRCFGHLLTPDLTYSEALKIFGNVVVFKHKGRWITLREDEILLYDLNFHKRRLESVSYNSPVNPP